MNVTRLEGWCDARLGDIASVQLGKMLSAKAKTGRGGRPYLRNLNVRWHRIEVSDVLQMDFDTREVAKYQLLPGDVLVCEGGEPGRAAIWTNQLPGALYQKALHRVRFTAGSVESRYFVYFMELAAAEGELAARFTGSTIKHLPREAFLEVMVPLAPVAEQRRIIAALEEHLSELEAAVAGLERARANAIRYADAIRAAAVMGRLPTSATTDGAETDGLPDGWRWTTIESCASHEPNSITDGPFGSKLKTEHYTAEGPRVVRLQNVGRGQFIDARAHVSQSHFAGLSKHRVHPGDLVIAALGESLPRSCIVPSWIGPAIVKADCIRFRPDAERLLPNYANIALNSDPVRKRVAGMVHGVGRPRLNLQEIKSIQIPLPPLEQQSRIAREVERHIGLAEHSVADIDTQLLRATRLRRSILKYAFEGKLVPQDPNDEPASALLDRIRAERMASRPRAERSRAKGRNPTSSRRR